MPEVQNKFFYREGNVTDAEQLQELGIASYGQYEHVLTPENFLKLESAVNNREKWTELVKNSRAYVCVDDNRIVGMAFLLSSGNPWDIFKAEWSYIRMVGVHPRYQGQGIAKTLTKMCIEQARQSDEKTIALHTSEFMDAARHIYESLGFKRMQEIDPRFGKKYWLYLLSIDN